MRRHKALAWSIDAVMNKRGYLLVAILAGMIPLTLSLGLSPRGEANPTPVPKQLAGDFQAVEDEALSQAILQAIMKRQEVVLGFLVYEVITDNFRYSDDGKWGSAWLGYRDPETGEPIPSEPGLALASRDGKEWKVVLPSDPGWQDALKRAPESMVPSKEKDSWILFSESHVDSLPPEALTGYLLPWAKGERRYLSQSIGHDKYTPSGTAHYAFDFYLSGKMWNLYASKGGTVWKFKYDVPTCIQYHCDQSLGNYIVLRDETTYPVSYQLYLHLAYDSIPPALRQVGAPVLQGQFLGIVDNTGQSWGHHLHFQVHTNPTSYYSNSVDITFTDVSINGGRPRVSPYDPPYCKSTDVCKTYQNSYISGNTVVGDLEPPEGDLVSPSTGSIIKEPRLLFAGYASDNDSGFHSAQLVANYDGSWKNIGPVFTSSPFAYEWDMCGDAVQDGPISVGMRVRDNVGNLNQLAGIQHVIKRYACQPAPACVPGPGQAAVYKGLDYEGCVLFEKGSYPNAASLGVLGSNTASSVRAGSQSLVTLFAGENYRTRGETFADAGDAGLADNLVGAGAASSMLVSANSQLPLAPLVELNQNISMLPKGDVLTLVWENTGGVLEYQVQLRRSGELAVNLPWQSEPYLHLIGLKAGLYNWKVRGRNTAGEGPYSTTASFEVAASTSLSLTNLLSYTAPYTDNMDGITSFWTKSGMWTLKNDSSLAYSGAKSWWFQGSGGDYDRDNQRSYGGLTSPAIQIPGPGFYLRFWYRNETEGSGSHWDQRWVQISAGDGSYENVLQLTNDPRGVWLQSPFIDLSAYAGQTIRVRFSFDTIDAAQNAYKGWAVDDVAITADAPPACAGVHASTNPAGKSAVMIAYGANQVGEICPAGDRDTYRFYASAGDRIVGDVNAQASGSSLDPILYLLDGDGTSVLAEHDDRLPGELLDPLLDYTIRRSGDYYLVLNAWDHPGQGGEDYFYSLSFYQDSEPPAAEILFPSSGSYLPAAPFKILVNASDDQSGISHIEFYRHSGNWLTGQWVLLGVDKDGQDGWEMQFDPSILGYESGMAFAVRVFDGAGNTASAGAWHLIHNPDGPTLFLPVVLQKH